MEDETDINEEQAAVGDVPDLDPVKELEQSLEQLEENGELGIEKITIKPMIIGGVHLDQIGEVLSDVGYERDPVRITIEPVTDNPEDHHYQIRFEDLELDNNTNTEDYQYE